MKYHFREKNDSGYWGSILVILDFNKFLVLYHKIFKAVIK